MRVKVRGLNSHRPRAFDLRWSDGRLGRLRIELYRPVSDRPGGPETQDAVWNIDLRDPRENAAVYDDLVTRTYTVYLASLPSWLDDWASPLRSREASLAPLDRARHARCQSWMRC